MQHGRFTNLTIFIAALAVAVSEAGGIGFIGAVNDMERLSTQLKEAASLLANSSLQSSSKRTLPIGVGFLPFAVKLEDAMSVIAQYPPAIIWVACPVKTEDFKTWTEAVRKASPDSKVWIQVGSIAVAVEVAEMCKPDLLVMQGSDAGGHGPYPGAGIVSAVPELQDALTAKGLQDMPVFAAGGISDGRGVAAAIALGAEGVVLGTKFIVSKEIELPAEEYRDVVLAAKDGGRSTTRGTIFDELKGKSIWPEGYDGRAVGTASYVDFTNGVGVDEIRKRYAEAASESHKGFGGEVRGAVWAGSGVGLVNEIQEAGEIVRDLRAGAQKALEAAMGKV